MRQASGSFLFILVFAALLQAPAQAQVISVNPTSFDFGDMQQQQTKTANFIVTNEGAALLRILDVKADCGCTVPTLTKHSLGPGESTEIAIEFNSKKFHGTVIKSVNITSNDPINGQVDLLIMAKVHTPLVIDPVNQRVGFSRSMQGEALSRKVTFTATSAPKLEISATKTRQGMFDINVINDFEGDPQVGVLEIIVPANMEPGRHRDHVRVKTNIPDMESVDIEMQAWVTQALTVSPEQVSFRYKKNFQQTIRVAPFEKGLEFKVTGAEIDLPEISVEVVETIPNMETKVLLTGAPIGISDPRVLENNGYIKGTLIIHTDSMSAPVLKVPVSYMVRK